MRAKIQESIQSRGVVSTPQSATTPNLETPIPTAEHPALLIQTMKNQARILNALEQHGTAGPVERDLKRKLQAAIDDLEQLLSGEVLDATSRAKTVEAGE